MNKNGILVQFKRIGQIWVKHDHLIASRFRSSIDHKEPKGLDYIWNSFKKWCDIDILIWWFWLLKLASRNYTVCILRSLMFQLLWCWIFGRSMWMLGVSICYVPGNHACKNDESKVWSMCISAYSIYMHDNAQEWKRITRTCKGTYQASTS